MSVETDMIKRALALVEIPGIGHEGSCGPESGCDGACMVAASVSDTLREAENAISIIERRERSLQKIIELAYEWGWNGVDNSKLLETFLEEFVNGEIARASINEKMRRLSEAGRRADARIEGEDDYVAWMRWRGDEAHKHLVLCDSDSPGAFKVYRRPPLPPSVVPPPLQKILDDIREKREEILEDFRRAYLAENQIERVGDAVLVQTFKLDGSTTWHFEKK